MKKMKGTYNNLPLLWVKKNKGGRQDLGAWDSNPGGWKGTQRRRLELNNPWLGGLVGRGLGG